MSISQERLEGGLQEGVGAVREGWGRITNQPGVEASGQAEQLTGRGRQFFDGIRESVGDAVRKVRQDPGMERSETRRAALKLLVYIAGGLVVLNALLHAPRRRQPGENMDGGCRPG